MMNRALSKSGIQASALGMGCWARLQTDYIDVYQLHQGSYPVDLAADLMETLEDLVAQGKIRWVDWFFTIARHTSYIC